MSLPFVFEAADRATDLEWQPAPVQNGCQARAGIPVSTMRAHSDTPKGAAASLKS